jgi:uncharacterized repeat protein (TIGR03803 family)
MKRTASTRILSGLFALAFGFAAQAADGLTVLYKLPHNHLPYGRLALGDDGAFYGTTYTPSSYDIGDVYKVDADGNFSVLHKFELTEGYQTFLGLTLMDDGNFYGTLQFVQSCQGSSCTTLGGTVFRVTPDGALTTLHTFTDYSTTPLFLTASRDGLLYGMTRGGGSYEYGTAYAMGTDGTYVELAEFNGTNGRYPSSALIEGADGNFYGTTSQGGAYDKGTIFRMTPDGTITTFYSFTGGSDGSGPGNLLLGKDGRFYVSAYNGGYASVFAITAEGELTTVYAFNGGDGYGPGGLIQDSDGYLYGVSGGGYLNYGNLFRLSTSGQLTILHLFVPKDGVASPVSTPIFGRDGRLYGTTLATYPRRDLFPKGGGVYAFDLTIPRTPEVHVCNFFSSDKCQTSLTVPVGGDILLSWTAANVSACRASGAWNGIKRVGGTYVSTATQTGTLLYRLDCTGPDGPAHAQVVVNVVR